jgi:lipid II:glycine glycyltransferase (peptidoglycan interpeptide bridge formation enzyme)
MTTASDVGPGPAKLLGPAARAEWDAFVAGRPEGDVLQSWAWGEAAALLGQRAVRIGVRSPEGRILGVAQALVRDAPLGRTVIYTPHGPVWDRGSDDADAVLRSLVTGLRRLGRTERAVVVKMDPRANPTGSSPEGDPGETTELLASLGMRPARHDLQARHTLIVDLLDGGAELMKTWDSKGRNLARRSAREGVEVRIHRDADNSALETFHGLLVATGERAAFRTHPAGFLRVLAEELGREGWFLGLAYLGDRPIAGMVAARVGDRAYYLYGATDRDPALRNANGGYGTMAAMMEALAGDGVQTLDLWGVADEHDPGADPEWQGFSAFKRRFGGQPLRHPGAFDLVVDHFWYLLRDLREQLRDRR